MKDHVYTPASVVVSHAPTTGNAFATGFICDASKGSCSFKPTGKLMVTATATGTGTAIATGIDVEKANTVTINSLTDFTVTATSAAAKSARATGIKLATITGREVISTASITDNKITLSCGAEATSCVGVTTGLEGAATGRTAPFVGKLTFTGNRITTDNKASSKGIEMYINNLDTQEGTTPNFFNQFTLTGNALECEISGTKACDATSAAIFISDNAAGQFQVGANRNANDRAYRGYLSDPAQENSISNGGKKVIIEGLDGDPIDP